MTNIPPSSVVPATDPSGRIFQTVKDVLAQVRQIFDTAGVALPELQFVSNGAVAYDGELVAIEALRLRPGKPGIPSLQAVDPGTMYSLETVVHIIRKVPTLNDAGEPPTADEIEESAEELHLDWWTLYKGVLLARAAGATGDPGSLQGAPFRDIMVQEIVPYGPQSDVGGLVATLVCELA